MTKFNIYFLLILFLTSCVTYKTNVTSPLKNSETISLSKSYYLLIQQSPPSGVGSKAGCRKVREKVSKQIYNFLKSKNVNVTLAEGPETPNEVQQITQRYNFDYIIVPETHLWSDLDYVADNCMITEGNVNYFDEAVVSLFILDVKNRVVVGHYVLYSGQGSNTITTVDPVNYLNKALNNWWKKQK